LIAGGALLFVAAAAGCGNYYWTIGRFLVSTDDAYVQAHSVLISPKVSGYISEVPVDDNQAVKAGQVIARIDPRDYDTALDQARRSPSNGSSSNRTASKSPRIRRRSSIRSRIISATPYWLKTVMARCSGPSKRKPTFAKKTPCSSMTLRL
jgi:multidrug efflux pump subunit AcrA (membrane-fusion protein)